MNNIKPTQDLVCVCAMIEKRNNREKKNSTEKKERKFMKGCMDGYTFQFILYYLF